MTINPLKLNAKLWNDQSMSAIYSILNKGLNALAPILLLPISSNLFGVDEFAKLVYFQSIVGLIIVISDYGFTITGIKEASLAQNNPRVINKLFNEIKFTKIFLLLSGGVILYLYLKTMTNKVDATSDVFVFFLVFLSLAVQSILPNWLYQGTKENKKAALINFISKIVLALLVYFVVLHSTRIYAVPFAELISFCIALLLSVIDIHRTYNLKIRIPSIQNIRKLMSSGFDLFLVSLIYWIINGGVLVVTENFVSTRELAFFAVIMRIAYYSFAIFQPVIHAVIPFFAEKFALSTAAGMEYFRKVFPIFLVATLVIVGSVGYFMEHLLNNVFDSKIASFLNGHRAIPFLVLGWIFLHLINNFTANSILLTNKKQGIFRNAQLANGLTVVCLVPFLVPAYLATGSGACMLAGEGVFLIYIFKHSYQFILRKSSTEVA